MKKIIVFEIRNLQDDYAKCFRFMEQVNRREDITDLLDICTGYVETDIDGSISQIACEVEQKKTNKLDIQQELDNKNILWCFRIKVEKEDDIVNLMHFYLIKQIYKNIYGVLITPSIEYDMKISAYLSFEIEKDRNAVFIKTSANEVKEYGAVHRLVGSSLKKKREWKLTKFLPLIEVTDDTYVFLSGTVETARKDLENNFSTNYHWEKTVMNTCDRLFTQFNNMKSTEFLMDEKYANVVNNTTVLTYILFCTFRNHCVERRSVFDIDKIEQELSDARDIAEGVLQILENIILHSQNKVGYFSFRVHDREKSEYLKKKYSTYMSIHSKDVNDIFLEMFIADCYSFDGKAVNRNILCTQFVRNLYERSICNKALERFIRKFEHLEVKHFFDNDIWKDYNAISDNIIEHYGLLLFDKIISSCNGCFELISTTSYAPSEEQFYSSVQKNIENLDSYYVLPGTQYRVLLPITERNLGQEHVGMDFYEYPEEVMLEPINQSIISQDINLERIILAVNSKIKEDMNKKVNKENQKKVLKKRLIIELSEVIYGELKKSVASDTQYIAHFLLNRVKGAGLVEIIFKACMKALIRLRDEVGYDKKIYIAYGKLTKEFITEFCYLMGIYYYKAEDSRIMMNTEMYFWNKEYSEDLSISGRNLSAAHNAIMERAILRGIYPRWLNFVDYVWKKYSHYCETSSNDNLVTMLPYEVIIKDGDKTIFEHIVKKVLQTPFEQQELGCLIKNTHVQLASQIHISEFYNGQTLFLNNYFTNYFSYLLVKDICSYISKEKFCTKHIVLVGYESYSEMLLVEMSALLKIYLRDNELTDSYKVSPYIICEMTDKKMVLRSEQGSMDKRNIAFYKSQKDNCFIFIVPLNSTMTTFRKMQTQLEKSLDIKINAKNNIANYALIVSRDNYLEKSDKKNEDINCMMTDEEREYWKEKKDHVIVTKGREISIKYFIEVCAGWEKAATCKQCFPADSICEKPLIKTDITGLSPLTQLGEKRKWLKDNNISRENMKRLKCLSEVLRYNHIKRGENHYLYYFDTTTFFYQNQKEIREWIKGISVKKDDNAKHYNFVVSPLHATNAGFTEEINKILFKNTAHIIRLDFCKTYRSNFMKQFSYLQILYCNIMQYAYKTDGRVEINFYFVDDEVVSGKTFIRAKSLIEGLFDSLPKKKNVKIHVFKKIFVLINRLSDASKHNYVNNIDDYESYVNFNVSVIQNHDDFCFMCKLVERANHYKFMSATNIMDKKWGGIENKFKVKDYIEAEKNEEYRQQKYRTRMIAAHYSEGEMWEVSENATLEQYFCVILNKLFYTRLFKRNGKIVLNTNNQEIFISFIKTLSRPFFVYRNKAKEAALHLIIAFSECLLGITFEKLWHRIESVIPFETQDRELTKKRIKVMWDFLVEWRTKMDDSTYSLLLDLLEQLADMESNYLIRQKNVIRIFKLYDLFSNKKYGEQKLDHKVQDKKNKARKEFELQYALFIKQITNEDVDETKSLWVEHLFYTGGELNNDGNNAVAYFNDFCGYKSSFGKNILIENTKLLYDGIKCLNETINDKTWKENGELIVQQDKIVCEFKDTVRQSIEKSGDHYIGTQLKYFKHILNYYNLNLESEKIVLEVLLFGMMFHMKTEEIPFDIFYRNFYWLIKEITGAKVQILMLPNSTDMDDELFYHDVPCVIYDERQELNRKRKIKLQDKPLVDSDCLKTTLYEMDTYSIREEGKCAIIKYSINTKHRDGEDSIYLILQYPQKQEIRKLLFDIRLILLCRSRTITRMKRDFNNNLFQSMWQTKRHNMLLEHFKNVSHINPEEYDAIDKVMDYINEVDGLYKEQREDDHIQRGLKIYKALLLKMLADNNISSIYHEILAKRFLCNYVRKVDFNEDGLFSNIEEFGLIFNKKQQSQSKQGLIKDGEIISKIIIKNEVLNGFLYYVAPNVSSSQLAVFSLLQNAYKHGNGKQNIHVYREKGIQAGKYVVDYLCITNGIDVEDIGKVKERVEEHIKRPVASRKILDDSKCDGITLFSINRYCQKIVGWLQQEECKEDLVKYEIKDDRIIFKIPILEGDK